MAAWAAPSLPARSPFRTVIRPCLSCRATSHTLTGYANANPTVIPSDMTNQKSGSPGHIARMSRPIMSTIMTGAIPAIIEFIETSSGIKLRRTFST